MVRFVNASSSATKAVALMFSVAGSSGFYTSNPIERHFRDIQVLKQYGFYSESRYETVGQVYTPGSLSRFPSCGSVRVLPAGTCRLRC